MTFRDQHQMPYLRQYRLVGRNVIENMKKINEVNFEHYSIRILGAGDVEIFFGLIDRNRARLEAFFSGTVARTRTTADTEVYLAEILVKIENRTYLPFMIQDNATGSYVGFVDIKNIDWNIPKGELGFFIDSKYEGKNLSTRAFTIFTFYCFSHLGFNKLFLRTHESNLSARRLAEKCGFEVEGIIRKDYKTTEGELVDLIYFGRISLG